MKKKNGFTLVEILVVVVILVIVVGIFSVNMISSLNRSKNEGKGNLVAQITSAADAYVAANPEDIKALYNGFGYVNLRIGQLRDKGFLSEDMTNPETGDKIRDDEIVRAKLSTGNSVKFIYPVTEEELNSKAWTLVAEDLVVDYGTTSSDTWCGSSQNKFVGLHDSAYTNVGDYANVKSKLYLMDNATGAYYSGNYFSDAELSVKECNVNPQVSGTYNVVYELKDPATGLMRTFNRTVYVKTSGNDVISFTATINNDKRIKYNTHDVPVTIVETYKDGSTLTLQSTVESLNSIDYQIENFSTAVVGTFSAKISRIKANSDGSTPDAVQEEYTIINDLVDIVQEDCTSSSDPKTCYLRCEQNNNFVLYNNQLYRMYGATDKIAKLIYASTEITSPYGQLGNCTSTSCCNGGRYTYNRLGTPNANVPAPTMDVVLDNFYTNKSVASDKIFSQSTQYGSKKVALLSKVEYEEISRSCNSNYLLGQSFWLIEDAGVNGGPGAYNKGVNPAYAYNYAVNDSGVVYTAGAHKGSTFYGDFYTGSVITDRLAVRPTVHLKNPTVIEGDGSESHPYVLR